MKVIIYYVSLLLALILIGWYVFVGDVDSMSMPQMLGICSILAVYTIILSLVGEGKLVDEREQSHRFLANRLALIVTMIVISLGIIVQLFVTHHFDLWLLGSLIVLNLTKILSLIYLNYKK